MQGAGTLCLELLGHWDSREAVAGVKNIAASFQPAWDDQAEFQASSHPSYVWYYCTQAVFHGGERVFRAWNATLMPMLVRNQKPDGHWECPGLNSRVGEFDPYFSTALNTGTATSGNHISALTLLIRPVPPMPLRASGLTRRAVRRNMLKPAATIIGQAGDERLKDAKKASPPAPCPIFLDIYWGTPRS